MIRLWRKFCPCIKYYLPSFLKTMMTEMFVVFKQLETNHLTKIQFSWFIIFSFLFLTIIPELFSYAILTFHTKCLRNQCSRFKKKRCMEECVFLAIIVESAILER